MTMTSTGRPAGPQPPQHLQAGHVRQVDVEQHEVRAQPVDLRQRLRAGRRRPDHLEARRAPATNPACTFATMKSSSTIRTPITSPPARFAAGSVAVNVEPPAEVAPSRRRRAGCTPGAPATARSRAPGTRPGRPRPCVEMPRRKISRSMPAGTPAPESRTTTSTSPSTSPSDTSTQRCGASAAASMRVVDQVADDGGDVGAQLVVQRRQRASPARCAGRRRARRPGWPWR